MSEFLIYVLNSSNVRVGNGAITSATQLKDTRSLDKVGNLVFNIPASDPMVAYIQDGARFDVYDSVDGYLGRYYRKGDNLDSNAQGNDMLQVSAEDQITLLKRDFVGFRRQYTYTPVDEVILDLLEIVGFTATVDAGIGNTSVVYEGESVMIAVDEMRDRWGQHFRNESLNRLEFGALGAVSDVLLTNLNGVIGALGEDLGAIISIKRSRVEDAVYNRIIPLGGGQGEAQTTIEGTDGFGDYETLTGTNQDGSNYYYIQDGASIAIYGLRTRIVQFPSINPISNNDTDIERARVAVKLAGEAYLARQVETKIQLNMTVVGLPAALNVGDRVKVQYKGYGEGATLPYIDVDDFFYVMDITRSRRSDGRRDADLVLCSVDERRTADTDIMVDVIHDLSSLRLHIQPHPFWSENTWTDFIGLDALTLAKRRAIFKLEIDDSITRVTKVRIRFKSRPLFVNQLIASPAVSPWSVVYNLIEGDQHPKDIKLYIDGIDVTSKYGGTWNPRLSGTPGTSWSIGQYANEELDVTLDITEDIVDSPYGLRADHIIMFESVADRNIWSYIIPGHGATSSFTGDATSGTIELNVRVQGVTQGIVPV